MKKKSIKKTINAILNKHTGYEIAKQIGVKPEQINRLKRGERKIENISLDLAEKILDAYATIKIDIK